MGGELKLNRKHKDIDVYRAIADISHAMLKIEPLDQIDQLNTLRGHEGAAAVRYFAGLGRLMTNDSFSLTGRSRRPPTDPVNSLLSFGYTLLFKNVLSLLLAEGLNPHLGNLHRSDRNEPHLAFDLMEEFRSPIIDTLIIQVLNQRVFRLDDFQAPNDEGGVYLTDAGRRKFIKHVENRFCTQTSHPDVKHQVDYRRVIQLQIQRYKRSLLSGVPYNTYRRET
ncbi:MAG TPA: CRISPR-associated endonuclease Cas1 [Elainellaceae cyanobacterium]